MAVRHRRRRNHGITRPVSRNEDLARENIAWQIHCPLEVSSSRLLGETEDGSIVRSTPDTMPELEFDWEGVPPTEVTITNEAGDVFGPYPVAGNTVNVTDELPFGMYTVLSDAENSLGELDNVVGMLVVEPNVFDWSNVDLVDVDFSSVQFDFSLVNG